MSKSGYNAVTETDPNNLVFSSDYQTLKYATSGSVSLNFKTNQGGGSGQHQYEVDVAHGFAYRPLCFVYVNCDAYFGGTGVYYPLPYHAGTLAFVADFHHAVNGSYLTIIMTDDQAFTGTEHTYTAIFKYFIFKNDTAII